MQFEREYFIGAREIGTNNRITNYGILALLEDIAGTHSDKVGYGIKDVAEKERAWILMDWKLKVIKRVSYGEKVTIKTWAKTMSKATFYSYRDFEVYNEQNELIAKATSKWVFIDIEKGKISKIDMELMKIYNPEEKCVFGVEDIEKIKVPDTYESFVDYQVKRFDIDVNNHMHNLNYLNLAYEALPEEVYNTQEFNNVRVTYKHQIKLGDKVKCYYNNSNGVHTVVIKSEDESITHAIIQLSEE